MGIAESSRFSTTMVNRGHEALAYRLEADAHASLTELLQFYNPIGGPVRQIYSFLGPPARLHSNVATVAACNIDRIIRGLVGVPSLEPGATDALTSGGKGFSLFDMFASSLGEGVERVVGALAAFVDDNQRTMGTYRELTSQGMNCLSPDECPLFSDEQYAQPDFYYDRFSEDSHLQWILGRRLVSGEDVWVPAQLVELIHMMEPDEALIGYAASGGLSCHIDRDRAIAHAATEMVERDALNLRWYLRLPPEEVVFDREPRDPRLRVLVDDIQSRAGRVRVLYHSLDFPEIPVFTAVETSDWFEEFSWGCGLGAALDVEASLISAIGEFGQSDAMIGPALLAPARPMSVMVRSEFDLGPDAPLEHMTNYVKAIGYYGHRESRSKLDWYLNNTLPINFSELAGSPTNVAVKPASETQQVRDIFEAHGIDPIVIDFTHPDLQQLVLIKVFIPQLTQPFLQSRPMFGHPRFAEVAAKYGVATTADGGVTLKAEPPLPYP